MLQVGATGINQRTNQPTDTPVAEPKASIFKIRKPAITYYHEPVRSIYRPQNTSP
jgi:hypothetical protein